MAEQRTQVLFSLALGNVELMREFSQTLEHGNSKIEIRKKNIGRKLAEKSGNEMSTAGTKKKFQGPNWGSPLLEAVDELPNKPYLSYTYNPTTALLEEPPAKPVSAACTILHE